jgi:hyperosmotically inducible protein
MISKYASALIVIGTLLVPVTGNAEDRDKDRSSPTVWVKDSIITTKIKAKYAEDSRVSVKRIHVDTDDKGKVQLTGTARSNAEKQTAAEIAKSIEGVVSVDNKIKVAPKKQTSTS